MWTKFDAQPNNQQPGQPKVTTSTSLRIHPKDMHLLTNKIALNERPKQGEVPIVSLGSRNQSILVLIFPGFPVYST